MGLVLLGGVAQGWVGLGRVGWNRLGTWQKGQTSFLEEYLDDPSRRDLLPGSALRVWDSGLKV